MGLGLSPGASDLPGDLAYLLQVLVVSETDNHSKLLLSLLPTLLPASPKLLSDVWFNSVVLTFLSIQSNVFLLPVGAVCLPWTASS